MPCLSGRYDEAVGIIINVGVQAVASQADASDSPVSLTTFPALIDTGATITCISPSVAQMLGLQPIGMRPMASATHSIPVNVYLVDLILPFGNQGMLLPATQVMEFVTAPSTPFQM